MNEQILEFLRHLRGIGLMLTGAVFCAAGAVFATGGADWTPLPALAAFALAGLFGLAGVADVAWGIVRSFIDG